MANTEGMSDEVMSSLLSTSSSVVGSKSTLSTSATQNKAKPVSSFRTLSLQQRMESDPSTFSDGPAAKVIRCKTTKSPVVIRSSSTKKKKETKKGKTTTTTTTSPLQKQKEPQQQQPQQHRPPSTVLGSIVERPIRSVDGGGGSSSSSLPLLPSFQRSNGKSVTGQYSKFKATSRQTISPTPQGYPSMHDRPLGTFVKQKKKQQVPFSMQSTTLSTVRPKSQFVMRNKGTASTTPNNTATQNKAIPHDDNTTTFTTTAKNNNNNNNHNNHNNTTSVIENEANSMLEQMSLDEIRQEQEELNHALSPETIAFLRKRHEQKQKKIKEQNKLPSKSTTITPPTTTTTNTNDSTNKTNNILSFTTTNQQQQQQQQQQEQLHEKQPSSPLLLPSQQSQEEKLKMATLLSSIRTEDELDVAFASMKGIDLPATAIQSPNEKDKDVTASASFHDNLNDFEHACNLLRSTVPRQVLWAVKTINTTLQEDLKLELQHQRRKHKEGVVHQRRTYPTLLPVALRCLLDEECVPTSSSISSSQTAATTTNASHTMVVHAHVLQALYTLLRLAIHPDHDMNVTTTAAATTSTTTTTTGTNTTTNDDDSLLMMTDKQLYQDYGLDDTCMTPSLELCYPPITVVEENGNDEHDKKNKDTPTAAAYATFSSSTSANVDAKAFWKDPLWTLLSKMQIIPRLVQLVSYKVYIVEESIAAICGILTLLSCRSPGAATAIVQHESLLSCLIPQTTLLPPYYNNHPNDDDAHENKAISATSTQQEGVLLYGQPKVALPALIMLCTLAQQSRIVASTLMKWINIIVPPILALGNDCTRVDERHQQDKEKEESPSLSYSPFKVKEEEEEDFVALQKQALVLWRIVLRYGLGISHGTTTFTTLGISHVSKTITTTTTIPTRDNNTDVASSPSSSSRVATTSSPVLAPEYLSSFAILCDCIKHVTLSNKNVDESSMNESKDMEKEGEQQQRHQSIELIEEESYSWMLSFVNQCIRTFSVELENSTQKNTTEDDRNQNHRHYGDAIHDNNNNNNNNNNNSNKSNTIEPNIPMNLVSPNLNHVKLYASRLQLMTSVITMITAKILQHPQQQPLLSMLLLQLSEYVKILQMIFYQSGMIQWALENYFSKFVFIADWGELDQQQENLKTPPSTKYSSLLSLLNEEIVACTILDRFTTLLGAVSAGLAAVAGGGGGGGGSINTHDNHSNNNNNNEPQDEMENIQNDFLKALMDSCNHRDLTQRRKNQRSYCASRARRGWINKCQFVISTFLVRMYASSGMKTCSGKKGKEVLPFLQMMAFTLLGRLEKGEERYAVYFFQRPFIFQPVTLIASLDDDKAGEASSIPSMFLTELCRTPSSRMQLNHSSKLLHGVGMANGGSLGTSPFDLETLLSNADNPNLRPPASSGSDTSRSMVQEQFLPLGKLWLWNVLSGTVFSEDKPTHDRQTNKESTLEVCTILSSCLQLLVDVELSSGTINNSYATQVANGAKLYHLFNICLYPENIIRHDEIQSRMITLFDTYMTSNSKEENQDEYDFARASFDHSHTSWKNRSSDSKEDDEKLFSLIGDKSEATGRISAKELLALEDFAGDLCNAYIEYGAQYDAFTKSVRFLLRPGFPSKIRCDVIHRLRNVLHLLSLPSEEKNVSSPGSDMFGLLETSLALDPVLGDGKLARDAPQVLNAIAAIFKQSRKEGTLSRWSATVHGYFFLWSIALLARSLATSVISNSSKVSDMTAQKTRLAYLPIEIFELIQTTAVSFLQITGPSRNTHNLVFTTIRTCTEAYPLETYLEFSNQVFDPQTWENTISLIKNSIK